MVNNLRYDSQKCLTALAKLFLDEASSRSPSTDNELLPTVFNNTSWYQLGGPTTIHHTPVSGIVDACLGIQVRIVHSCVSAIKINAN
jgi:hypothetical protein